MRKLSILLSLVLGLSLSTSSAQVRLAGEFNYYSTNFPATENPISQGGIWRNGATNGAGFTDCRTTPGLIFSTMTGASVPPYVDSTCVLTGNWGAVQTVEATVYRTGTPANYQEVELRLLTSITSGQIFGYEVLFSVNNSNPYVQIVKWLGVSYTIDNFVYIDDKVGTGLVTGNRIKATVNASGLISAYEDVGSGYVLIASGTDTTYRRGAPGIGIWNNTGGAPGTNSNFGLTSFTATATH